MLKVFVKTVILAAVLLVYRGCVDTISPFISTELAMTQMQNDNFSWYLFMVYQYFLHYSWIPYVVLPIIVYCEDVVTMFRVFKEKENEEV